MSQEKAMSAQLNSLELLLSGEGLTEQQSNAFFSQVVKGKVDPIILSAFLTALKIKGETPQEISGAAGALRDNCVPFPSGDTINNGIVAPGLYADNCGTGGDGSNTFNISTTASIVAAACGLPIVKHGNRSVSSRSGSADMLESFGVKLDMAPDVAFNSLKQSNLTFLFAPFYHSGIKHAMPVRKTLHTRTLFNILGPLVNPARPSIQLLGVFKPELCRPMAQALQLLGVKRAMVVHGSGMDEIALHGDTKVVEIKDGQLNEFTLSPQDFGLKHGNIDELAGGEPAFNANITARLLEGQGTQAHNSAIAVNVAALLYLFGQASDLKQGANIALEMIASGKAKNTLDQFIDLSQLSSAQLGTAKTSGGIS
jgi:anthranilate phosphoribosyltransferase